MNRLMTINYLHYPGRAARPGNHRFHVIPLILWKQYFGRKFFGFFLIVSERFLPTSTGSCRASTGKIRTISARDTASMFQRFSVFSCRIRWPESSIWADQDHVVNHQLIALNQDHVVVHHLIEAKKDRCEFK